MIRPSVLAMIPVIVICTWLGLYIAEYNIKQIVTALIIEFPIALGVSFIIEYILKKIESERRGEAVKVIIYHFSDDIIPIYLSLVEVPGHRTEMKRALEELLEHYDSCVRITESFAGIFTADEIEEIKHQRNSCIDMFRRLFRTTLTNILHCESQIQEEGSLETELTVMLKATTEFTIRYIEKNTPESDVKMQIILERLRALSSSD